MTVENTTPEHRISVGADVAAYTGAMPPMGEVALHALAALGTTDIANLSSRKFFPTLAALAASNHFTGEETEALVAARNARLNPNVSVAAPVDASVWTPSSVLDTYPVAESRWQGGLDYRIPSGERG
jgi:hypothetical protein